MKTKKPKRKNYKTKLAVVNIKMQFKERDLLMKRAKRHAKGNLSLWLRTSGLKYVPVKKSA